MPRKKSPHLTDAELRIMEIVWDQGEVTVADVVQGVKGQPPLAYSTVLTMLRILETKGYLQHTQQGKAFVYKPAIARESARENAVKHLVRRFFDNSPELLMLSLLDSNQKISARELARLKKRIAEDQ